LDRQEKPQKDDIVDALRESIKNLERRIGKTIPVNDIIEELGGRFSITAIERAIEILKRQGDIFEPRTGFIKRI